MRPVARPGRSPAAGALACLLLFAVLSSLFAARAADAGRDVDWSPLMIVRFGNVDAIDAEDGDLAAFLRGVRNDGRFTPPMRGLIGPEIRNPTFFGVTFEAWMECVVFVPATSGDVERLWVFPVENRDEYMTQLTGLGLSEYEGMDGVTVLRETDADGNVHTWHMEWLPGNVAVFGASRAAVASARRLYTDNSAARGLLARAGPGFMDPDILLRLFPPLLAMWQDREPGEYWWRNKIDRLTNDLVAYWRPTQARERLIRSLADRLALWPKGMESIDVGVWFEREGVEWSAAFAGNYQPSASSQLSILRQIPDRAALAWATPLERSVVADLGRTAGEFILAAAGGVVTQEAREEARGLLGIVLEGNVREAAFAWVPPPTGTPELGGCRLLVMEWETPAAADAAWERLRRLTGPDTASAQVFAQVGWKVELIPERADAGSVDVLIRPATGSQGGGDAPYSHATLSLRRNGNLVALVSGVSRDDPGMRDEVVAYRAELAAQTVAAPASGGPDVREAFTRAGGAGAGFLGFLEPVRFLQLCLIETGDWRPRSPDQHEPPSTQLAREMLEYSSGRAWTAGGECSSGTWRFTGGVEWASLSRLAAALGLTEAIGMD